VNDLRSENIRLHIDLHTAKQNRLNAWKEANDGRV
jgi:succinylglutamate desuccinylase